MAGVQKVLAAYQAGDFAAALTEANIALAHASGNDKLSLVILLSNIHLKMGNKTKAGDCFVEAARNVPEKRAEFFKFAVQLYAGESALDALIAVAPEAADANRHDKAFLYELVKACKVGGKLQAAAPFIADLDFSDSAQFMLLVEFGATFETRSAFYAFLVAACESGRGNDVMMASLRYKTARDVCDFDAIEAFSALVADKSNAFGQALARNELAHFRLTRTDDESVQLDDCYDTIAVRLIAGEAPKKRRPVTSPGKKLKIGYLSNDFCNHVMLRLFEESIIVHDRDRFEITLFCYTPEDKKAAYQPHWPAVLRDATVSVRELSDADAARLIADHEIDVLVDLKGFTDGVRMGIVKQCDAPVKATFLGFPGTVPDVDLDYNLTDAIVTPDASKPYFAERLCRLPVSYFPNSGRKRQLPMALSREDVGLPKDKLLLGSFNTVTKIFRPLVEAWARIMNALPDSVMTILCKEELARRNILKVFAANGVGEERIFFFSGEPYPRFLGRIQMVDVALDSFPCSGHTTTSDVLWVDTPVVAKTGGTLAARVSESLLHAIGLPELVAADVDEYCEVAIALGKDAGRRADIRQKLNENRQIEPCFDAERFARHMERAYEMMADRARNGLPPDHMDVPPLPKRTEPFLK